MKEEADRQKAEKARLAEMVTKFHTLKAKAHGSQLLKFAMYDDTVIGMGQDWVQESTIDHRMDDDTETDHDIYKNAIRQVRVDVENAEYEVSSKPYDEVIFNCDWAERVLNPDAFNRDGRPRRKPRQQRPRSLSTERNHSYSELF